MPSHAPDIRRTPLQTALSYAALGWRVIPGAVWLGGRFVDPADEQPVNGPSLRPIAAATTDTTLVRQWWSTPGRHSPSVLAVTGPCLGVVSIHESLVETIVFNQWFETRPTPVLALPGMPLAYFLVRPPCPITLTHDEIRVLPDGMTLPLPPTVMADTAAEWLVSPEETRNTMLLGDELADLINTVKGQHP